MKATRDDHIKQKGQPQEGCMFKLTNKYSKQNVIPAAAEVTSI